MGWLTPKTLLQGPLLQNSAGEAKITHASHYRRWVDFPRFSVRDKQR
jgi:hypothetical protein